MKGILKSRLGRPVVIILRPLMRAMIHYGVPVNEFSELTRQAYVDAAFQHFSIPGKKMSFARVAKLTGLSRKEVVRLNKLRYEEDELECPTPSVAQQVIQGWVSDAEYLTSHGYPRVLPLSGTSRSFTTLVNRYGNGEKPCLILEDLLLNKIVSRDHRSGIHLTKLGCIQQSDDVEKIHGMAECVADFLNTTVRNIESHDGDPLFQRQLVFTDVSPDAAERFRLESAKLSAKYLQQLNRLLAGVGSESVCSTDRQRVGLGIYYIEAPTTPSGSNREP